MSRSFLGRGIAFPFQVDGTGGLSMSAYDANIEECIRIILGTAPGERIYRPIFGCRIHDLLFAPNNAHTRNLVTYFAEEALKKFEPRIREIEVACTSDPFEANRLTLEISYSIRATNSFYNLVYPFFLRQEEDQ